MAKMDVPTTTKGRKAAMADPARGGAAAAESAWLDGKQAERRTAGTMECLSRMEVLARRLDMGSRQIGEALMEAAESPALADSGTVKDALEVSTMLDEQIGELSELVQRAAGTLRAVSVLRLTDAEESIDPAALYLATNKAFNARLIDEAKYLAAWQDMAEWKPTTLEGFARKTLALFGDGGLPERRWVDSLIADGARLVEAG